MKLLYHYTDFEALDGILRCGELRLNNILNMNDAAEMQLFMRGIYKGIMGRLQPEISAEEMQRLRGLAIGESKKRYQYSSYAACFSRYRDDAAQWERYGNVGRGVSLAIPQNLLQKIEKFGPVSLHAVSYQEDMHLHPLVDEFCDMYRKHQDFEENTKEFRNFMNRAWTSSALFKHPSFASENEVRLLITPFGDQTVSVKPQYHIDKNRIKKYYPLNLREICGRLGITIDDLVEEILIGPESTQSIAILQDYLYDNGLKKTADKLAYSQCPLRVRI